MSLVELMSEALPLNRKEKFFTATVLPMLVCREDFRYLTRFVEMLPRGRSVQVDARPATSNIQFFTEYSLKESLFGCDQATRWRSPSTKKTPDLVIYISGAQPLLIVIEAKMYQPVAAVLGSLQADMTVQQEVIACIREQIPIPDGDVIHCALLPESLARQLPSGFPFEVVTWERVYDVYAAIYRDDYFLDVLKLALEDHGSRVRVGRATHQYCDGHVVGAALLEQFRNDACVYLMVGQQGGIHGATLARMISSGKWETFPYCVRRSSEQRTNYIPIVDWANRVGAR